MPFNLERIINALDSIHHCWLLHSDQELNSEERRILNNNCSISLIDFLNQRLPYIPKQEWLARLTWGGVYVNGLVKYQNQDLIFPVKIDYYEPKNWNYEQSRNLPTLEKITVFEDEWLIALNKPAKFHVLPAKEQQHLNLRSLLEKYTKSSIHLPSRLDYSTSGLVICSKHPEMHGHLQRLFEKRQIKKTYLALGSGMAIWDTCLINKKICKDLRHPILRKTSLNEGQNALTEFKFLSKKYINNNECSLFEARPLTGRTHQIRVHLESLGHPIVGDNFYGGFESSLGLHLLSSKLEFTHPFTKQSLIIELDRQQKPEWANY